MRTKILIAVGCLLALAAAYGAGRFTAPSKKTSAETSTARADTSSHTETVVPPTVTTTVARKRPVAPAPKGCPECPAIEETTTTTVTQAPTIIRTDTDRHEESQTSKVTILEREYPRLTLGVGATASYDSPEPRLAVLVSYRVAGPVGVWVVVSGQQATAGVSVTF